MGYQASGIFRHLAIEQVQAIQARAVELLTEGKVIMSGSVAGQSFSGQLAMPLEQVLAECAYVLDMAGGRRVIRRTRVDFSRGCV